MSTTDETTVESPDGTYQVTVAEVWEAIGILDTNQRTIEDSAIIQAIKEAMLVVEDAAADDASPEDRKTVVLSRAGQFTLEQNGETLVESMSALDVDISYDVDAQRSQLESRADMLLDAIRPDPHFVFRSL